MKQYPMFLSFRTTMWGVPISILSSPLSLVKEALNCSSGCPKRDSLETCSLSIISLCPKSCTWKETCLYCFLAPSSLSLPSFPPSVACCHRCRQKYLLSWMLLQHPAPQSPNFTERPLASLGILPPTKRNIWEALVCLFLHVRVLKQGKKSAVREMAC